MKPSNATDVRKRDIKRGDPKDRTHPVPPTDKHESQPCDSWVGFREIADWLSREDGSIEADIRKFMLAFEKLLDAARAHEFDRDGETLIEFRPVDGSRTRWSVDKLREELPDENWQYQGQDEGAGVWSAPERLVDRWPVLDACFVAADLALRWFAKNNLRMPTHLLSRVEESRTNARNPEAAPPHFPSGERTWSAKTLYKSKTEGKNERPMAKAKVTRGIQPIDGGNERTSREQPRRSTKVRPGIIEQADFPRMTSLVPRTFPSYKGTSAHGPSDEMQFTAYGLAAESHPRASGALSDPVSIANSSDAAGRGQTLASGSGIRAVDAARRDARWSDRVKAAGSTKQALFAWAKETNPSGLPGRDELMKAHRSEFGTIKGISDQAMRTIRRQLATPESKRGGKPTHRSAPKA